MSWAAEHDDMLRSLVPTGISQRAIAEALSRAFPGANFSKQSVNGRSYRLGLRHPASIKPSRPGNLSAPRPTAVVRAIPPVKRPPIPKGSGFVLPAYGGPATTSPVEKMMQSARANAEARARPMSVEPAPWGSVTLLELGPRSCRWPFGDPLVDVRFCGCRAESGPYCETHNEMAWAPATTRRFDRALKISRRRA